jgi:hypothetical protein
MARIGLTTKSARAYAAHVEKHGIARVPEDATSLRRWLGRAREVLIPPRDGAKT